MEKIFVVIPVYNRVDCLKETLESIIPSARFIEKVIIVDQSIAEKHDAIISMLDIYKKNVDSIKIQLIKLDEPSLTTARNIGARAVIEDDSYSPKGCNSSSRWIIFCDDDVIWGEALISHLGNVIEKYSDACLIGGLDYERTGVIAKGDVISSDEAANIIISRGLKKGGLLRRVLRSCVGRATMSQYRGAVTRGMYGVFPEKISDICETEWAMGYFFAVKEDVFSKWNIYFDESLKKYAYAEDLDFTYRVYLKAKEESLKMYYSPFVGVWHKATKEWRISSIWQQYAHFMNRMYLSKKLFGHYFSTKMFFSEIYNMFLAFRDGTLRNFFLIRWNFFKYKSKIKKEGWYFLLEKQ